MIKNLKLQSQHFPLAKNLLHNMALQSYKKTIIPFKIIQCSKLTLFKKAVRHYLKIQASATNFLNFPLTTKLQKTLSFAGHTLCFHEKFYS